MLLILIIWLTNLTIATALGSLLQMIIFKNKPQTIDYLLYNGLFAYMLLIWLITYFTGFDLYFQMTSFILSFIYLILYPKYLKALWQSFKHFPKINKAIFFITASVVLMLSSAFSTLPDNESYYIQTIQWANAQGLIKGLINIHPFLGQFSGWHILQAGFNFQTNLLIFNDLNGLFFLIFVFYWLKRFQKAEFNQTYWLGLFPVVMPILIFFIDSPSPDLPVALLSLLVFDLFIRNYQQFNLQEFIEILMLTAFSFLIKPTAVINLFLVVILWWRYHRQLSRMFLKIVSFGLFIAGLWLSKNYLITGYLFYPFVFLSDVFKPAWQYPRELMGLMAQLGMQENGAINAHFSLLKGFGDWLRQPGIHQIVNPLMVVLLLIFPVVFISKKQKVSFSNPYWILYLTGLLYFIIILFISPNIRFFLPVFIFLALGVKSFLSRTVFYKYFNAFGWVIFLFGGIYWAIHQHWQFKNLLIPQPVSVFSRYHTETEGNLQYHFPQGQNLFWQTGDAPLPAVHFNQINYFKTRFGIVPQKNLKQNYYYSKPVNIN